CRVQKDRGDLGGEGLPAADANWARREKSELSHKRNTVHICIPLQGFFASGRVSEWRRRVRSSLPESEARFVEESRRKRRGEVDRHNLWVEGEVTVRDVCAPE